MKGVANSMKSATNTQITSLISQFNDLRGQVDQLANDTSFQGVSLINSTATTLTVEFSDRTASTLTVQGVSVKSTALAISAASTAANIVAIGTGGNTLNTAGSVLGFTFSSASSVTLFTATANTTALSLTIAGNTNLTVASGGTKNVTYGGETLSVFIASGGATFSASKLTKLAVVSATTAAAVVAGGAYIVLTAALVVGDVAAQTESLTLFNNTTGINDIVDSLDTAITTLTTNAQTLVTNVSLLQARLDFTENYVNTLEEASGKLTLADINEEGANLLSLQTRQQLGITALAFAGQSEQGILTLFQ
ncbi:MAG: flagellin [Pirellulaceae bacterium]|nr:flagellin [Pirellulaceae bacterium]